MILYIISYYESYCKVFYRGFHPLGKPSGFRHYIYNKIKHLATLIQDPILLQRICNGLPKREDEIGAISSHVRLMAKTVYQSIQEILQINKARDLDEVERNIIEQWRHSAINRQVLPGIAP